MRASETERKYFSYTINSDIYWLLLSFGNLWHEHVSLSLSLALQPSPMRNVLSLSLRLVFMFMMISVYLLLVRILCCCRLDVCCRSTDCSTRQTSKADARIYDVWGFYWWHRMCHGRLLCQRYLAAGISECRINNRLVLARVSAETCSRLICTHRQTLSCLLL